MKDQWITANLEIGRRTDWLIWRIVQYMSFKHNSRHKVLWEISLFISTCGMLTCHGVVIVGANSLRGIFVERQNGITRLGCKLLILCAFEYTWLLNVVTGAERAVQRANCMRVHCKDKETRRRDRCTSDFRECHEIVSQSEGIHVTKLWIANKLTVFINFKWDWETFLHCDLICRCTLSNQWHHRAVNK